jgi:serine/threonine protein kinase
MPRRDEPGFDAGGVFPGEDATAAMSPQDLLATGSHPTAPSTPFIGPYHLLRILGEGGMGQVWLAEQTTPLKRKVALKLIRAGTYDGVTLERFQSERQSLAMMNHPAIAKVFDAGATPEGQPYFVMEFVEGRPITEYCDRKQLSIPERLKLFLQLCDGVQHAHQKAVIHRDLKPANVLVFDADGKATPRIIDFGLAKALTPLASGETMFTQVGSFLGTPGYMSPEQADPGVLDVDTRTDVYSLGVILYELLTGALPFGPKPARKVPLSELLRQLREDDPALPSTQVGKKATTEREVAMALAESRQTEPKRLVTQLRGDLDWITLKALEKDRSRRYGTASELASDIQRYLNSEPVLARPASVGYRLRKYVRRHRAGVAAAFIVIALLISSTVLELVQLQQTRRERDRATRERDRATRVTDFMTNMFNVADPSESRGNNITAREILDKGSKEVESGLANDPEIQAQMMNVMGVVYDKLGLYRQSEALLRKAAGTREKTLGHDNADTLQSWNALSGPLLHEGKRTEAEKVLRATVAAQTKVLGLEHPDTLTSMHNLANVLLHEAHYQEAEQLDRQVLAARLRVLGPEHPDTIRSMENLAIILARQNHLPDAAPMEERVVELRRRLLGSTHPDTLNSIVNLANVYMYQHRYAEAEKLQREVLGIQQHVSGADHPDSISAMANLGLTLAYEHRYADAEQLERDTVESARRALGPEHPDTLHYMNNLADTLDAEHKDVEAESITRTVYEAQRRVVGVAHPDTAISAYNLGQLLLRRGHTEEALPLLREGVLHGPLIMFAGIETDPDLKKLHGDPRFAEIVALARNRLINQHASVH